MTGNNVTAGGNATTARRPANGRRKSKRRLWVAGVVAVCAIGVAGYAAYRGLFLNNRGAASSQELYQLVPVQTGSITLRVTASGTVKPGSSYDVVPKVSGTVSEVLVKQGDAVKKGQVLVVLDDTDARERLQEARDNLAVAEAKLAEAETQARLAPTQSQLQVEQARANLLNAEAKLAELKEGATPHDIEQARSQVTQAQLTAESAKKDYDRNKALFDQGAVSRQQLETSESKYLAAVESLKSAQRNLESLLAGPDPDDLAAAEAAVAQAKLNMALAEANADTTNVQQQLLTARAQVAQARNAVSAAERNLSLTRVVSPIDGTVTSVAAQVGQLAGQSTALVVVADLTQLEVVANVDETDVHKIKVGQPADVKVESVPGKVFSGVVESVATQGKVISSVVYFEVGVRVTDDTRTLLPGMTADVDVVLDRRTNVLTIPNAALEERRGRTMARTLNESGEPFFKRVELGISDGTVTEVVSGLEPGEMVAIRRAGSTSTSSTTGNTQTRRNNFMMPSVPGGGGMMIIERRP
ncbi:MAG: efflux RND transporter periplasmic adaptor subunit [Firmicutes bacterium]|jgi:HlyD family secretion protein|nr:efflux RND transporter periplasmic adaptor subunit [Bacillota bacterium]MDH7496200.1 efflux RND transporter periplasmic adaptor subunit [Bacillota bacterium]